MTLTGIVQNYSGLLTARFFLGKFIGFEVGFLGLIIAIGVTEAGLCMLFYFYVHFWFFF
jgi:hypothetical protein